jgi:hypothetical protein
MKIQLGDKIYRQSEYRYPCAKHCALKTASYVCVIGFRIRCKHHVFNQAGLFDAQIFYL